MALLPAEVAWTMGPECCELAALAGREPDPWQADGLDAVLGVREDDRWAAREAAELVGRQQGKTGGIGLPRALFGFLVLRERRIAWTAHQHRTTMEAFLDARAALYRLGEEVGQDLIAIEMGDEVLYVKISSANADRGFDLLSEWSGDDRLISRWRYASRSGAAGRGLTGDLNVIDEGMYYTREQRRALAPTLLARPNPQTLYLSSPPLSGGTGEVLFSLRKRAERGESGLSLRDWGLALLLDELEEMPAGERDAFLNDRANWAAALPALGRGRVTEESIEQLQREFDDDWAGFASEVLGLWPRQVSALTGWQVVPESTWREHGGLTARPTRDLAFSLDASWPDAHMGAIGVSGQLGRELTVQVVEHRSGTGWMVERAKELRRAHPHAAWVFDKRGPAGHLLGQLEDERFPLNFIGPTELAHAHGVFMASLKRDGAFRLRHYGQTELDSAVRIAGTRPVGDGKTWAKQGDGDISPLTAVTQAVWAAARRPRAALSPEAVETGGAVTTSAGSNLMRVGF